MDFSCFSSEDFNAKEWINQTLSSSSSSSSTSARSSNESSSLESFIATLVMKLQVLGAELSASLEEASNAAMARLPRALVEIDRMHEQAAQLHKNVQSLLDQLHQVENRTRETVRTLATLHALKQKIDLCLTVLTQARTLSIVLGNVDSRFQAGSLSEPDCAKIAQDLSEIRKSLKTLKPYQPSTTSTMSSSLENAAELSTEARVAAHETQLQNLLAPVIIEALSNRDTEIARERIHVLMKLGVTRVEQVLLQYAQRRIESLKDVWRSYDLTGAATQTNAASGEMRLAMFLTKFIGDVQSLLHTEAQYFATIFPATDSTPDLQPPLLLLLREIVSGIIMQRQPGPSNGSTSLEVRLRKCTLLEVLECFRIVSDFASTSLTLFGSQPPELREKARYEIFDSFSRTRQEYSSMEKQLLSGHLSQLGVNIPSGTGPRKPRTELIESVEASSKTVFSLCEEAINRCIVFTNGIEVQGLLNTLNSFISQYSQQLVLLMQHFLAADVEEAAVASNSAGSGTSTSMSGYTTAGWDRVQNALKLHIVALNLSQKLASFETKTRAVIAQQRDAIFGAECDLRLGRYPNCIYALKVQPEKAKHLCNYFRSLEEVRIPLFSPAAKLVQAFQKEVERLVRNALFAPIALNLALLPSPKLHAQYWTVKPDPDSQYDLPTFSPSPTSCVSQVGEYLFTLPQQLEILHNVGTSSNELGGNSSGTVDQARYWLDVIMKDTVDMLIDKVMQLQSLSELGTRQLAADVESLEIVINAMTSANPVLRALNAMLNASTTEFAEATRGFTGLSEKKLSRRIAELRGIQFVG